MAQVSVGQIENLEDLIRGLESVREALDTACREEIEAATRRCAEAKEEVHKSESMLEQARQKENEARHANDEAQQDLDRAENELNTLMLSCVVVIAVAVAAAEAAVLAAAAIVAITLAALTESTGKRQQLEQRVDLAKQALASAEQALDQVQQECTIRMSEVENSIDVGKTRLSNACRALDAYMANNQPLAQFHEWLQWNPQYDKAITPDVIRDRMNLSGEQQQLLQEYLYERNPAYRNMVDKYRGEWSAADGDVERNIVSRDARIHLSGEYQEQLARYALAPLGGKIETQGRTNVGDSGRYTKTDLLVRDLRVPVILGRGGCMAAPQGGSMAFEVKSGKPEYLYNQKEHMLFQAEGHKQADAHCTLCSRDIHDLSPEKEQELRDSLRTAGSPLVGMLPKKNEIDRSCLAFIKRDEQGDVK
jgi:hypothetical protein